MTAAQPFAEQLRGETILSEQLRARILSTLFATGSVLFLLLTTVLPEDYNTLFGSGATRFQLAGLLLMVSLYEYALYRIIMFRERRGKALPEPVRYWNAFLEISIPTVGMYLVSESLPSLLTLVSPLAALYFVFIMLSILRLNIALSIFTGCVAAVEYLALSYVFRLEAPDGIAPLFASSAFYVARSIMLLGAGIVAGIIARVTREKILLTIREVEAKNQAIDLFGQQVSEPVARELLKHAGTRSGSTREVTVMFLDIRDFTPFAARHTPTEVVEYLNTLFGVMIRIIGSNRGIVNQFLGDGFMTTFGAPIDDPDHAANAVAAAFAIQSEVQRLCDEGAVPPTRIGIGIHSGPALTGNIGSDERRQYSVTGTTVILASRIEQLNKTFHSTILVSSETLHRAGLKAKEGSRIDDVSVKGSPEKRTLYRLL